MTQIQLNTIAQNLFLAMDSLIPKFLENPDDFAIAEGNVCCLIMDEEGNVVGKHWGTDRVKQRKSAQVGWQKVMQVWLTDTPTGTYEEKVYSKQMNWWEYGIPLPELIGWQGGLPARLADGSKIAIAFSGFHGDKDCAIIRQAAGMMPIQITVG
jgi:glc operon protein GlcG